MKRTPTDVFHIGNPVGSFSLWQNLPLSTEMALEMFKVFEQCMYINIYICTSNFLFENRSFFAMDRQNFSFESTSMLDGIVWDHFFTKKPK